MDHSPPGCTSRPLVGCFIIFLVMICSVSSFVLVGDQMCRNELNSYLPPYPDAELIYTDYNFIRPFGIGQTVKQYYSEDDPITIRAWYGPFIAERSRTRRLTRGEYHAVRADDGEGSYIFLVGRCFHGGTFQP
ncbi:MAG: hypothetical protein EA396_01480 [Anaerolineaceae bacterium]|nr:MAG: hypothetical protein EA396_01480 [Anaerolineaceae bacterium]